MSGLYAADGSINVSVVSGATVTGQNAPDGSMNVVLAPTPVVAPIGVNHPCGARWVTLTTSGFGAYAPDGSQYVVESPYNAQGAIRVTAVSGDLTPGPATPPGVGNPIGLLLALTYAS